QKGQVRGQEGEVKEIGMTSTRTTAAPGQGSDGHPCGCAETQPEVCRLECLEKPRFSCGQLLTDQDLTALVAWAEKKAALARYRHGWGVVCGLDVHCDPRDDGKVMLEPGYAVSCCGRDIVVCEERPVSLETCCKTEVDPCETLVKDAAAGDEATFGGMKVNNVRAIDLVLYYAEKGDKPRAALSRGNCRETTACEDTRTKETYRVECSIVAGQSDPSRVEAANWAEQYGKWLDVVRRDRKEVGGSAGADVQRWLTRWLDKNPLHYFCFLKHWLCGKSAEAWTEKLAVEALFWIVQDCRNAFLHCGCFECQEDLGVPIARVWVKLAAGTGGKSQCQGLTIDTQPPYRRARPGFRAPAPLGDGECG